MNVLLINPPRSQHNQILEYAPEDARPMIHKKLIGPPLGLLTIAGAVRDHEVHVLDLKGEYDLDEKAGPVDELVRDAVMRHNPDVVGVTFIASEYPVGMEILRAVKALAPHVVTVAGGLHVTLCLDDFRDPAVDVACVGHGTEQFRELVAALECGRELGSVKGLYVRHEGELWWTGDRICPDPAREGFVYPDRSLVERWRSTYRVKSAPGPTTYVFTSLGCPHRCSFCSIWPQMGGVFHQREVESLIWELQQVPEYPVVRFADANTVVNVDFISTLFDRIAEEGIEKEFVMDIRPDTAVKHSKLIEKMAKGGLMVVISGFESFRNEELDAYRKGSGAREISESIRIFHENGIMVRGNYVIPPDYDRDDFRALAQFAGSQKVALAGYTILTPMPGTQYHRDNTDKIIDHDPAKYNFFNSVMRTTLPLEEFCRNVGALWLIRKGRFVI